MNYKVKLNHKDITVTYDGNSVTEPRTDNIEAQAQQMAAQLVRDALQALKLEMLLNPAPPAQKETVEPSTDSTKFDLRELAGTVAKDKDSSTPEAVKKFFGKK